MKTKTKKIDSMISQGSVVDVYRGALAFAGEEHNSDDKARELIINFARDITDLINNKVGKKNKEV